MLVRQALDQRIPVVPVPGASAALTGLIASGLSTGPFLFTGFLPRGKKHLTEILDAYRTRQETLIVYESPHRLVKTLQRLVEMWGDRNAAAVKELTKKHETWFRGRLSKIVASLQEQERIRGEWTIIVEGSSEDDVEPKATWWAHLGLMEHVESYREKGASAKDAIKQTAADRGMPKREVYNTYHRS